MKTSIIFRLKDIAILSFFLMINGAFLNAQIKISDDPINITIAPDALLELESDTLGLILPRLTTANRPEANSSNVGMFIYNKDSGRIEFCDGVQWLDAIAAGLWRQNGNTIYYNSGNVGIGSENPQEKLHIAGNLKIDSTFEATKIVLRDTTGDIRFILDANAGAFQMMADDTLWYTAAVNSEKRDTIFTSNGGYYVRWTDPWLPWIRTIEEFYLPKSGGGVYLKTRKEEVYKHNFFTKNIYHYNVNDCIIFQEYKYVGGWSNQYTEKKLTWYYCPSGKTKKKVHISHNQETGKSTEEITYLSEDNNPDYTKVITTTKDPINGNITTEFFNGIRHTILSDGTEIISSDELDNINQVYIDGESTLQLVISPADRTWKHDGTGEFQGLDVLDECDEWELAQGFNNNCGENPTYIWEMKQSTPPFNTVFKKTLQAETDPLAPELKSWIEVDKIYAEGTPEVEAQLVRWLENSGTVGSKIKKGNDSIMTWIHPILRKSKTDGVQDFEFLNDNGPFKYQFIQKTTGDTLGFEVDPLLEEWNFEGAISPKMLIIPSNDDCSPSSSATLEFEDCNKFGIKLIEEGVDSNGIHIFPDSTIFDSAVIIHGNTETDTLYTDSILTGTMNADSVYTDSVIFPGGFGDTTFYSQNGISVGNGFGGSVGFYFDAYSQMVGVIGAFDVPDLLGGNAQFDTVNVDYIDKFAGSFKIDHPLDPYNKYLYHSFVESPDMMNIYNGNIVTDEDGKAFVDLPKYFEALNKDFRYQLTVIGTFAQAIIDDEINNNQFAILTNKPNVKVSWQVTGIRNDRYARENRIEVEVEKKPETKGTLIYNPNKG